ncbi:MAG: FtsQ-type POTRA domain-containing protein [Myxococcota bacterium]|nr:FtsQ-type POTRA domain-containing protein [Myxococcota bacterium]
MNRTRRRIDTSTNRVVRNRKSKPRNTSKVKKARRSSPNISWRRVGLGSLAVMGALALGTAISFGANEAYQLITSSEVFEIDEIIVAGTEKADKETIKSLSGARLNENIFTMNLDVVQKGVAAHPWVRSVHVERKLPRKLLITVTEFEPVLMLALEELYYVNSLGRIVKRYTPGENLSLPLVTGLTRDDFEKDELNARSRLSKAISFLNEYKRVTGEEAQTINELYLDPVLGLEFLPLGEQWRVKVGNPPWRQKIKQWERIRNNSELRELNAREVILGGKRRPERVVMRMSSSRRNGLGGAL